MHGSKDVQNFLPLLRPALVASDQINLPEHSPAGR